MVKRKKKKIYEVRILPYMDTKFLISDWLFEEGNKGRKKYWEVDQIWRPFNMESIAENAAMLQGRIGELKLNK